MQTNNKLREALTKILNLTNSLDENCAVDPVEIRDIAKAALAAPPRNCDIGTAEEQRARFEAWCEKQPERYCKACAECPTQRYAINCFCNWAQMPYVEKEGGAK